jgi:hypothetical protein
MPVRKEVEMRKTMLRIALTGMLVLLLTGCDPWIYQIAPTPTPVPPPPPGSACAAVTLGQLQSWMDEKLPRSEKEVPGGIVYMDPPRVVNCDVNKMYFQVRVGYQSELLVIELALLEHSFDLRYDEGQGNVCLDLLGLLSAPGGLEAQGVSQVGQEIKVAETRASIMGGPSPLDAMPPEVRQQFDQAVAENVGIQGDPETQGIGDGAAQVLLDWAVGELLQQFNNSLADLIGACVSVP